MTSHPTHVPLSALAIDPMNVRKTDRAAEPEFVANVAEKGIIVPLVVRPNGKGYLVTNGGKRFDALQQLLKKGTITNDYEVKIVIREEDDKSARDTSLSANMQAPMHPVDEFEAFKALQDDGATIDQIAKRYGLKRKDVEQALALGGLSAEVRTAWRDGKIGQEAAQAFTIEPDHKRQADTLARLMKQHHGHMSDWYVKQALRGDQQHATQYLKYVTPEAYEKAGGRIIKDLFAERGDSPEIIGDLNLLKAMVDEKVGAECKRLTEKEGWGWAEFDESHDRFKCDRIEAKKMAAEAKKKAGCFLFFDYNGTFKIECGYVKGKAKVAGEKAAAAKKAKPKTSPNQITGALERRLKEMRETAIKGALNTMASRLGETLGGILAKVTAARINPGQWDAVPTEIAKAFDAIIKSVEARVMTDHLCNAFKADVYFAGLNAAQLAKCLDEMGGEHKPQKKADAIKLATKLVRDTGWLPPQLRTTHYIGPATPAKAKPTKPAPKAKAVPRKKAA